MQFHLRISNEDAWPEVSECYLKSTSWIRSGGGGMMYVGVDIGKRNHEMGVVDDQGQKLGSSFSFSNTTQGAKSMLAYLYSLIPKETKLQIGMEATGHYWLSLYSFLTKQGLAVAVINPLQSDSFRNMQLRKTKTDAMDAFLIADLLRFGQYKVTALGEEKILALRQLSRFRLSTVDICSSLKKQAIALLDQLFPEYETLFSDLFGKSSMEVLQEYTTPEALLDLDTETLTKVLLKASKGRLGKAKAQALQAAARDSFGLQYAQESLVFQLKLLLQQIQFTEKQITQVEDKIAVLLAEVNSVVTTLPGVGPVVGAILIGEIGDISRFEDCHKLVAFAGLDASVHQSGAFTGTQNHISKRGSPYLRRALWNAAVVAAVHDPVLAAFYQKKRAEGKAYGTAIGAVARKLTFAIFAVLRDNKPYQVPPHPAS